MNYYEEIDNWYTRISGTYFTYTHSKLLVKQGTEK